MWQANVFTIFPEAFPGNLGVSIIGKALAQKKWSLNLVDLKNFPVKSNRIDSSTYGGGEGMILSPMTFELAFDSLSSQQQQMQKIYLSPRGKQMQQIDLQKISVTDGITMLCGRYEGVDQRILDYYNFEEISIGNFVLMGGEVAAMVIIEGCVRLLTDLVGNSNSIHKDSFQNNLLEFDQYTKPKTFHHLSVPEILTSGHHNKIDYFRLNQSKIITKNSRPDLWKKYVAQKMKSPENN